MSRSSKVDAEKVEAHRTFVRNAFNYDRRKASLACGLECYDLSRTQQSQKDEADINMIVKRFGLTGQLPSNVRAPTFGDFDQVNDFQTAMNVIVEAERSFMKMPAEVRSRFNHSPQLFVEFCSDEKNLPEMRKLGLAIPEKKADNTSEAAK